MMKGLKYFAICSLLSVSAWAQTAADLYNDGVALAKQGQYEQATQKYQAAIQANPNLWQAFMALGNAYHYQGKNDEALKAFNQSLALHPDNPTLKAYVDKLSASTTTASPAGNATTNSPAPNVAASNSMVSAKATVAPGLWIGLYAGYDYSFQGDIVNGLKALVADYELSGFTMKNSTSTGGIVSGLDFGLMLDKDMGFSISGEYVLSLGSKVEGTDGTDSVKQTINPDMIDISLYYQLYFINNPGAKTYFKVGGGYYHGLVDYAVTLSGSSSGYSDGTFAGDTIGGAIEVGEEIDLGGSLSLGISARGRIAVIDKLLSSNVQGVPAGTYALGTVDGGSGNRSLGFFPTSFIDGSTIKYATVDMSGINGNVSLKLYL